MHFNIFLPSTHRYSMLSLSISFSVRNLVCNFLFLSVCNMPSRSHCPWFDRLNKVWWTIQISVALHYAVFSSHLLLPLSSFSDTFFNTVLQQLQSVFFRQYERRRFRILVIWRKTIWWPSHERHTYCCLDITPGPVGIFEKSQPLYPVTTAVPCAHLHNDFPER